MPTLEHLGMATSWGPGDGVLPGELLIPDPTPRPRHRVIISVDDHLVEPGDLFSSRFPAGVQDRCPRVVDEDDGRQYWLIEGGLEPNVGANAAAGRSPSAPLGGVSVRFDEMRIGVDHIMVEADYPHVDSTWPDTQAAIEHALTGVPLEDAKKIAYQNAARLYRHPLPS
jgi:Amidohydrolase